MARGWESKSVEAQQADASDRQRPSGPVSAGDAARRSRLTTLTLARCRAAADLTAATVDAHRAMLQRAIADLDRQIDSLTRK
jgi:hypothetical protein